MYNFNSHTREGVTLQNLRKLAVICYFNSHTREGVTIVAAHEDIHILISTHTPVRV